MIITMCLSFKNKAAVHNHREGDDSK